MRQSFARPAIIDLGELGGPEYRAPARVSSPARYRLTAAMLAGLCVLALGASVTGTPALQPLWSGQVSLAGFTVGPEVVTLSEPGTKAIEGRDLWTGRRRWRLAVPSAPELTTDTGDGTSAVVLMNLNGQSGSFELTTTLVDPSGRVLAEVPGYQLEPIASNRLLLVVAGLPAPRPGCAGGSEPCSDVPALDRGTGREVWRQLLPGNLVRAVRSGGVPSGAPRGSAGDAMAMFATVRRDGRVDVRDLATGTIVDSVRPPGGADADVLLFDDTLVTAVRGVLGARLTGYRLGPLRTAWSLTVPVSDVVTDETARFYLTGCGDLVCLHADGANAVIEPATGRLRGQVGVEVVGQVGDTLLAKPSTDGPGPTTSSEVYLLDATDGQRIAALPHSVVVRWRDNGGAALVAQQGRDRTAFTVWDARRQPRPLGSVTGTNLSCEARAAALVCTDPNGTLRAWRLPIAGG